MKKIVSLVLALIMMMSVSVCVPVSAESTLVQGDIMNSVAEDTSKGYSVSFCITANVAGVGIKAGTSYGADYTNATVEYNGTTVKVLDMGVMFTNNAAVGVDPENLYVGAENGNDIIRIPVKNLYEVPEEDSCIYVARIINIPYFARDFMLTARPYFTIEVDDAPLTVYSEVDNESYLNVWGRVRGAMMPEENLALGEDTVLEKAEAKYSLDPADKHNVRMSTAFTVRNDAASYTADGSFAKYVCYDENGAVLQEGQVDIRGIAAGATATYTVDMPTETMEVAIVDSAVNYFTLPAIGTDIDVAKKKNRIRVSEASATLNEDDTYTVSLTFRNYTSNWITEETDYVKYACYDKAGQKIGTDQYIYIGCIDTKKNKIKTFTFNVPADAVEVKLTGSKIVYWTEWA